MTTLNKTLNPISAAERAKINENWDRITQRFSQLQIQISLLSGEGEVEELLNGLSQAIQNANTTITNLVQSTEQSTAGFNDKIAEVDSRLIEIQTAINNAVTATTNANTARNNANTATTNANTAANNANNATNSANEAAQLAQDSANNTNQISDLAQSRIDSLNELQENLIALQTSLQDIQNSESLRVQNELVRNQAETVRNNNNERLQGILTNFDSKIYVSTATYDFPNFVLYNGSTYIALKQVRGITPSDDNVNWRLAAQRGIDGAGSVSSVNSKSPDPSGNVIVNSDEIIFTGNKTVFTRLNELNLDDENKFKHVNFSTDVKPNDLPNEIPQGLTYSRIGSSTTNQNYLDWRDLIYPMVGLNGSGNQVSIFVESLKREGSAIVQQKIDIYDNVAGDGSQFGKLMFTLNRSGDASGWSPLSVVLPNYTGSGSPEGILRTIQGARYYDYTNRISYIRNPSTRGFGNTGWLDVDALANGKYTMPSTGIPESDLSNSVVNKLNSYTFDNTKTPSQTPADFVEGITVTYPNPVTSNEVYNAWVSEFNNLNSLATTNSLLIIIKTEKNGNRFIQTMHCFSNVTTSLRMRICNIVRYSSNTTNGPWNVERFVHEYNGSPEGNVRSYKGFYCTDINSGDIYFKKNGDTLTNTGWVPVVSKNATWINVTGQNSFPSAGARYFKNSLGEVHLNIYSNLMFNNGTAFTLPIGYRPEFTVGVNIAQGTLGGSLFARVNTDGTVNIINPDANSSSIQYGYIVFKAVEG